MRRRVQTKRNHCKPQRESPNNPPCKLQKCFLISNVLLNHQDMHGEFQIKKYNSFSDCTLITFCHVV
jgi:hypothetical protein